MTQAKAEPVEISELERTEPTVEVFATNLHNPSHMEWTNDGRLLVSEYSAGRVMDITDGGDMRDAEPFATGLEGPSSILPLEDGRLLITEAWSGRVTDISGGGDFSDTEPFASDLSLPYSLSREVTSDGEDRITVTEKRRTGGGSLEGLLVDITEGGGEENHSVVVDGIPTKTGAVGHLPLEKDRGDDDFWNKRPGFDKACNSWSSPSLERGENYLSVSPLGEILEVSGLDGASYQEVIERDGRVVARGLDHTGGLKYNNHDDLLYGVEPKQGTVFAVDPDGDHKTTTPAVVRNLNEPSCLRFGPDNEMYVCSRASGTILKITDFR